MKTDNSSQTACFRARRRLLAVCLVAPVATVLTAKAGLNPVFAPAAGAQEIPPLLLETELLQHTLGEETAPNTLVEYSSLTCPHCALLHSEIYPRLLSEWVETGQLRIVYRHFPLDGTAVRAALLAECFESNEAFFAFVEILYKEQATWARQDNPQEALLPYAALAGVDNERAEACMADEDRIEQMSNEFSRAASELGIRGTPSLFLNGERFENSADMDRFFESLKAKLKG